MIWLQMVAGRKGLTRCWVHPVNQPVTSECRLRSPRRCQAPIGLGPLPKGISALTDLPTIRAIHRVTQDAGCWISASMKNAGEIRTSITYVCRAARDVMP